MTSRHCSALRRSGGEQRARGVGTRPRPAHCLFHSQLSQDTGGALHLFRGSLRDATEGLTAQAEFGGLQLKPLEDEVQWQVADKGRPIFVLL